MMRPIDQFPEEDRRLVHLVLTDIDDTVTADGLLPSASLAAMESLSEAGISVVPVTGRPAGWCDHIARMWPVDAVVGENGALYFAYDRQARKMKTVFAKDAAERAADRRRLDALREKILREVPGTGIASDQDYRVADLAVDFCEDVPPLPKSEIARIVAIFEDGGAIAKISSIHVNGWFGTYDKLSMTKRCLQEVFGLDIETGNGQIVFIGDSPNDSPMFAFFKNSIGVANVRDFDLPSPPAWITKGRNAAGFIEAAEALLAARIS
jgi:HAD superfamily hydrolase (TIGR01484 family)